MNEKQLIVCIHSNHANVLNRHALVAHVTGHFHVLPALAWIGTITDRTCMTMESRRHRGS